MRSQPSNHCLIGGAAVLQKEYRSIATKVIDVGNDLNASLALAGMSDLLTSVHHEPLLAVDRSQWWSMDFEQVKLSAIDTPAISDASTIVITVICVTGAHAAATRVNVG